MSDSNRAWAHWQAATGFQRRVQQLVEKHRKNAGLAASEYLAERRAELADELVGKQIIYLDTKH